MEQEKIELLVILETTPLKDKEKFEKHVKKEGFKIVEGEDYVYTGISSTTLFATKAFILEIFKEGLKKVDFDGEANLIFLLNETPYPAYYYDKNLKEFEQVKEEQ